MLVVIPVIQLVLVLLVLMELEIPLIAVSVMMDYMLNPVMIPTPVVTLLATKDALPVMKQANVLEFNVNKDTYTIAVTLINALNVMKNVKIV